MAKGILKLFGRATIAIGFLVIAAAFMSFEKSGGSGPLIGLSIGATFLITGAPLLGFARVIELLEEIARNTQATRSR